MTRRSGQVSRRREEGGWLLFSVVILLVLVGFAFSETAWLSFPLLLAIGAGQSLLQFFNEPGAGGVSEAGHRLHSECC